MGKEAAASWRPKKLTKEGEAKRRRRGRGEAAASADDRDMGVGEDEHKKGNVDKDKKEGEADDNAIIHKGSSSAASKRGGTTSKEEDPNKQQPRTRRGGRRNRRREHREKVTVRDSGLKKMVIVMAKLQLQTAMRVRMLWAGILDVAIGGEETPPARAIAAEGDSFSEEVEAVHDELAKAKKEKNTEDTNRLLQELRDKPAPARSNYMGLVEALAGADNSGGTNQDRLRAWLADNDGPPPVQVCKLQSIRQPGKIIIILGQRDTEIRHTVLAALEQHGFTIKMDMPPPTGLEDDVSSWLEELEG